MRRAFTLIELMTVLAIIALAATIAAPAIRSVIFSSQQNKAIQTFDSLISSARSAARSQFTRTALRIERAFEIDEEGLMIRDATGNPRWLAHQQARLLVFGSRHPEFPLTGEQRSYRQLPDTGTTPLPEMVWLAPDYALSPTFVQQQNWQPADPAAAPFDTLDTFYVGFNRRGELMHLAANRIVYLDETQGNLLINHPHPSARSAVAYDRRAFEPADGEPVPELQGIPLYVTRHIGSSLVASR